MAKFALLYIGDGAAESQRDEAWKAWSDWIGKMMAEGKLPQTGSPLKSQGTVLTTGQKAVPYDEAHHSKVTGYSILEAANLEEATALVKDCPQIDPRFGTASLEIREVLEM